MLGKLTAPASRETLKLAGIVTVPTTPTLNPAGNGVRLLLSTVTGTTLLDATIPGGAGWRWTYKNDAGFSGLTKAAIRTVGGHARQAQVPHQGAWRRRARLTVEPASGSHPGARRADRDHRPVRRRPLPGAGAGSVLHAQHGGQDARLQVTRVATASARR